jgi:hypothetical protein
MLLQSLMWTGALTVVSDACLATLNIYKSACTGFAAAEHSHHAVLIVCDRIPHLCQHFQPTKSLTTSLFSGVYGKWSKWSSDVDDTSGTRQLNSEGQIQGCGHLERELQMVQLSATTCSCITIL